MVFLDGIGNGIDKLLPMTESKKTFVIDFSDTQSDLAETLRDSSARMQCDSTDIRVP